MESRKILRIFVGAAGGAIASLVIYYGLMGLAYALQEIFKHLSIPPSEWM